MFIKRFDVRAQYQGGFTELREETELIIVHHAAALYPQENGISDVDAVARYHLDE